MRKVGTLVGYTSTRYATFRVLERVRVNDLVLVDDGRNRFLGVVRRVEHANVARSKYSPFIVEDDEEAIDALGYMNASVELLGVVRDGCVDPRIPEPPVVSGRSAVYLLEGDSELSMGVDRPIYVGEHPSTGMQFPLDGHYYNYHIAVVGATGTGKSHLNRLLIKALAMLGVRVLVMDHTGQDYAPYFAGTEGFRVISDTEVLPNPAGIASVVADAVGGDYVEDAEVAAYAYVFGRGDPDRAVNVIKSIIPSGQRGQKSYSQRQVTLLGEEEISPPSPEDYKQVEWDNDKYLRVLTEIMLLLNRRSHTVAKVHLKYKLSRVDLSRFNGRPYTPEEVAGLLTSGYNVVLDLSNEPMAVKWSIFNDVLAAAWESARAGLIRGGLAVFVDEAQNYASQGTPTAKLLEDIARRGRKYGVGLVLASQRWVADLATGIRSNINTVIFGQLAVESDLTEIGRVVAAENVDLASLGKGYFYVAGLMNPLRKPLLIHTFSSLEKVRVVG